MRTSVASTRGAAMVVALGGAGAVLAGLAGCGQKGPLVLPQATAKAAPAAQAASTAAGPAASAPATR